MDLKLKFDIVTLLEKAGSRLRVKTDCCLVKGYSSVSLTTLLC